MASELKQNLLLGYGTLFFAVLLVLRANSNKNNRIITTRTWEVYCNSVEMRVEK